MNRINNQSKYLEFRDKYPNFIYDSYEIEQKDNGILITFNFETEGLTKFNPSLEIPNIDISKIDNFAKELIFHVGLIEIVNYWKATCSPNVIIKAGYINKDQINWFKKLFYYGQGEMFYLNSIENTIDDFMNIIVDHPKTDVTVSNYEGKGSLIPIGGGKDSNVSLELLKGNYNDNVAFIMNKKDVTIACANAASYSFENNNLITINRNFDRMNLLPLNEKGFLNGHTPFSAMLAFHTYLVAYLTGKKYITLSNEASANEPTVPGTKINHQYSKTYEFENDFNNYTLNYFGIEIKYFSLLRPLSEFQIVALFAKYKKYHQIFRSCNVGSLKNPWEWCCNCSKCLFVYTVLSPFVTESEITEIFGENMFDNINLKDTLLDLAGKSDVKPFECVGTTYEVRYALSMTITNYLRENKKLPSLLDYYYKNYELTELDGKILHEFNEENNLPPSFAEIVKEAIKNV